MCANWCLSGCLVFAVPRCGRVCCHLADRLYMSPTAHFVRTKCAKALRGHPLKPHFTGAENRLKNFHNGTPSKKTSCVCPARTLLHSSLFLSAFASGCLMRRSSLQDAAKQGTPQKRQRFFSENRASVRARQTLRLFRSARAVNRWYEDHLLLREIPKGERLRRSFADFSIV